MKAARTWLACGLVACCCSFLQAAGQSSAPASAEVSYAIRVRVFNVVRVSPRNLAGAERAATTAFQQAEVICVWLDCTLDRAQTSRHRGCEEAFRPLDFAVAIVPRFESELGAMPRSTLGIAALQGAGGYAHNATISMERVEALAKAHDVPVEVVLGLAMVHEIGHLLLGSNTHSPSGLMRNVWDDKDSASAARGGLRFAPIDRERLRAAVKMRQNQEERMR